MVITALDKNNINKKRQLLPAELPKGNKGQYGALHITIGCFLRAICFKLFFYFLFYMMSCIINERPLRV